jgi:transposase-like protein
MVLDILAAIGLKETGQYVAKDVLLPLLQGSLEDYAKDFFKSCIADAAGLAQQEPVQKALGKALKAFVELVEEELAFQGCAGAEIRDFYEIPLREFMQDADVKATLGHAFEPDCRSIDAEVLKLRWADLDLRPLPEEFDWPQIGKQYVRTVKGILRSDDALRDLLKLHNQEAMRRGIETLVGIPPDFDLGKYQETLREQYGNLKIESLDVEGCAYNNLKLWRMFIPQDVRPCQEFNPKVYELPKDKLRELVDRGELDAAALDADLEAAQLETYHRSYREQPIQNVLEVIGRTTGQGQRSRPVADYAVVLGDPGSGKSTLLQYVALQWAEQPIRDLRALAERPLPLLIELRKYGKDRHDQKCSSVVEYLHQGEVACRLNQRQLHEVLQAGDAIALFDGVDEVFDPHLRDVVVTDIHRFTNDYPQVQVIVTSRWLGYKAQLLRDAGFDHYMLQDLTDEQVGEFVQRWHDQTFPEGADKLRKRERLHRALRESRSIRQLAGNPLLLTMMAILNRNQELPRDRPELYTQASRVLLHQWDVERNLIEHRLDPVTIDYRDKQAMLRKVAYHMQSGAAGLAGNIISAGELERILTDHLRSMEVDKPREMARLMIKQLRERNFILCYLGADNYAFVHRTFLEFFAAWAFVWEFKETQTLSFEELKEQTFGHHWQEESWQEVLRLIAGMVEPKFVGSIIADLTQKKVNKESFVIREKHLGFAPILGLGGFRNLLLAAHCVAEVHNIKEIKIESELLLQILIQEFESQMFKFPDNETFYFWDEKLSEAVVSAIADGWRNNEDLPKRFKKWAENSRLSSGGSASITAIAQCWSTDPETLPWLRQYIENNQSIHGSAGTAIRELARGWREDPETLPLPQRLAQNRKNDFLRSVAIRELARGWKHDSNTLQIIKSCIQGDEEEKVIVRAVAIEELARGWQKNPNTLRIIEGFTQTDEHWVLWQVAIRVLAEGWKAEPSLFNVWCKAAQSSAKSPFLDQDKPRKVGLSVLVDQYPNHPKTMLLLKNCVHSEEDKKL